MIKALNLAATQIVELDCDPSKGTDAATKFVIGTLNTQQSLAIAGLVQGGDVSDAVMSYTAVKLGLRGWTNLKDENGVEVPFTTEPLNLAGFVINKAASDASVSILPAAALAELTTKIIQFNNLSGAEEKN